MEVLLILPFILLAMAVPTGVVGAVLVVSGVLSFIPPLRPVTIPILGGACFVLIIKRYTGL